MMTAHWYLFPAALAGELPAKDWRTSPSVNLIAGLDHPTAGTLYTHPWTAPESRALTTILRRQIPKADIFLGLQASNEQGLSHPALGATLVPWNDDAGWLAFCRNLRLLADACRAAGIAGLALDAECYLDGGENNGGKMVAPYAWPPSPRAAERGRQFRAALGSLPLVVYVWLADARRFPAFGEWSKAAGVSVYLDEGSYVGGRKTPSPWQGRSVVPGVYLTRVVARNLSRRRQSCFLWCRERPGAVW